MNIDEWLRKFKEYWQKHDISGVLSLFDKNVVYYETPFHKFESFEKLTEEWEGIKNQKNISLSFEVFSCDKNRYSVIFKLKYSKENTEQNRGGTYLIELNGDGLCIYFHHSCEALSDNVNVS